MEQVKADIKDIMEVCTKAVMYNEKLDAEKAREVYFKLDAILGTINESEVKVEVIDIPNLPKGDYYNPYPRFLYAMICEYHSKDKFFTIQEMADRTGASWNQTKADLKRLSDDGYIKHIDGHRGNRSTKHFKYEPCKA